MPVLKSRVEEKKNNITLKKLILPCYIVLSLMFILFVGYSYFKQVVYSTGINVGQQNGYVTAVQELINEVNAKCEPVTVTSGETQVSVINISCLQAPSNQGAPLQESSEDTSE